MAASVPKRFPILFTGANRSMALLGIAPSRSWVEVDAEEVRVRMSWAFRATFPRSSVRGAAPDQDRVLGWGVHGWRGRWLVNGSSSGLVRVELDRPARGWVMGWPVRVRTLRVSVTEPGQVVAALLGAAA